MSAEQQKKVLQQMRRLSLVNQDSIMKDVFKTLSQYNLNEEEPEKVLELKDLHRENAIKTNKSLVQ
jgi:hypothetical protein